MAFLGPVVLLILPLVTLYFQFAVSAEVILGEPCNSTTHCKDRNAMCLGICKCKDALNKDSKSRCKSSMIGADCNTTTQCKDGNAMCNSTCICKDAFYKNRSSDCADRIPPNKSCGKITDKNESCVVNAYCNASSICDCLNNFTPTPTSCYSAATMAVVEIPAIILCFMLAYFDVLK